MAIAAKRRRSPLSIGLLIVRVAMILAGVGLLALWVITSIGGYIHIGFLATAIGLFVGAFGLSYLD